MKLEVYFDIEPWMDPNKPGNVFFQNAANSVMPKVKGAIRYKCIIEVDDPAGYVPDKTIEPVTIEAEPANEEGNAPCPDASMTPS